MAAGKVSFVISMQNEKCRMQKSKWLSVRNFAFFLLHFAFCIVPSFPTAVETHTDGIRR
jgi:hypothetical protein